MTGRERVKVLLLILLGLVHIFISVYMVIPGYLSVDEPTYHMMVKNYSESRGLEIWNGYREFSSPELASAWLVAHNGRLVSGYPYLHSFLGTPFYRIWGFRGLFVMNSMAFLIVMALCFTLARRMFSDLDLALNACLILALATFVWEYSQAAWTHMTALLFNVAAFLLCYLSLDSRRNKTAAVFALASGVVAGFGVSIRLDLVFVLACLALIFFWARPGRRRLGLAFLAGSLPGLVALSVTNYYKFSSFMPLTSGPTEGDILAPMRRYLPLLAFAAALAAGAWLFHRTRLLRIAQRRKIAAAVAILLIVGVVLAVPATRMLVWKQIIGTYTLVVDLRVLPLDVEARAMLRSPGRGVLYIGGLKKSLLQSCPYLVMLTLPALALLPKTRDSLRLGILFLIPVAYLGFYSHRSWDGGLCLNLRYFTAILPYTSILTAYAVRQLSPSLDNRWRTGMSVGALLMFTVFLLRGWLIRSPTAAEFFYLTLPLILAGVLLILILLAQLRDETSRDLSSLVVTLCFMAMVWSGLVAFAYDYTLAQRARHYNLTTGEKTASLVAGDSIFFANSLDRFFALIESDRVRIARPSVDDFRDLPRLVEFHLAANRRVYAAFQPNVWRFLRNGPLAPFEVTPIWSPLGFTLAEISATTGTNSAIQSQ